MDLEVLWFKVKEWFLRLIGQKAPVPKPKTYPLLPAVQTTKRNKVLNLSKKRSYCFRCPWGTLHRSGKVYVECRKRGKVYGLRKLERGILGCKEESRIRVGKIIVEPVNVKD
jgi:hypothetical protein